MELYNLMNNLWDFYKNKTPVTFISLARTVSNLVDQGYANNFIIDPDKILLEIRIDHNTKEIYEIHYENLNNNEIVITNINIIKQIGV